jgi:hypothetical protein
LSVLTCAPTGERYVKWFRLDPLTMTQTVQKNKIQTVRNDIGKRT